MICISLLLVRLISLTYKGLIGCFYENFSFIFLAFFINVYHFFSRYISLFFETF